MKAKDVLIGGAIGVATGYGLSMLLPVVASPAVPADIQALVNHVAMQDFPVSGGAEQTPRPSTSWKLLGYTYKNMKKIYGWPTNWASWFYAVGFSPEANWMEDDMIVRVSVEDTPNGWADVTICKFAWNRVEVFYKGVKVASIPRIGDSSAVNPAWFAITLRQGS